MCAQILLTVQVGMSASMAKSFKCKACVELQHMELQQMELQRLAAAAESDAQVFSYPDVQVRSTLPRAADTIPKELLDQIPEEYFDVQHHVVLQLHRLQPH